jgi:exopolyphosphatase/guanosine-5'-triphosphate,3'-diphosphate pyrophosphatase
MAEEIKPRWEWRCIGDELGTIEKELGERTPDRVEESEETYLLSARTDACVKLRGGLLDVKVLFEVSEQGLEHWNPIAKDPFPVGAEPLRAALGQLGVPDARLEREAYSVEQMIDEVIKPNEDLRAVRVGKVRRRHTIGPCAAELTDLEFEGRTIRTVAIESTDHDGVVAAVEDFERQTRPNVSLPRGLKQLVGLGAHRYAVIDVGTNSVKFLLAERSPEGAWSMLVNRSDVARLGEGLDKSGRLSEEAMARTLDAIAAAADEAWRQGADGVVAVGTAGLRAASNSAEFIAAVEERCGIKLEVISGQEEARLSYLAAIADLGDVQGSLLVFESGGGSTQFTFGRADKIDEQFSVDAGAVRYAERFGLTDKVNDEALAAAMQAIAADLSALDGRPAPAAVVAMGGTVTNLAAIKHQMKNYDPDIVQGTVLDLKELDRQIEMFRTRSAEERRAIVGLQPKRADIILAGACIVRSVLAKLGVESLMVSDRGLRHRLVVERFGP